MLERLSGYASSGLRPVRGRGAGGNDTGRWYSIVIYGGRDEANLLRHQHRTEKLDRFIVEIRF